jgi:hypothetical protein
MEDAIRQAARRKCFALSYGLARADDEPGDIPPLPQSAASA